MQNALGAERKGKFVLLRGIPRGASEAEKANWGGEETASIGPEHQVHEGDRPGQEGRGM